jgi:hypothetical protein
MTKEQIKNKIYEIVDVLEKDANQFQEEGERLEMVDALISELYTAKPTNPSTKEMIKALEIILDFVERWNKQDREKDVAEASQVLESYIVEAIISPERSKNKW